MLNARFGYAVVALAALTLLSLLLRGPAEEIESGFLTDEVAEVAVPVELGAIGLSDGAPNTSLQTGVVQSRNLEPGVAQSRTLRPAGRVDRILVEAGATVQKGAVIAVMDKRLAAAGLARAEARKEVLAAQGDLLDEGLESAREGLDRAQDAEAQLRRARRAAGREFNRNLAKGEAALAAGERSLQQLRTQLVQAEAGLAQARAAVATAEQGLVQAQALPDADPQKAALVAEATAAVSAARAAELEASQGVAALNAAVAGAEQALVAGRAQLTEGRRQFSAAIARINAGISRAETGQDRAARAIEDLEQKRAVITHLEEAAATGVEIARIVLAATEVRAPAGGRIKNLLLSEGSVAFSGQAFAVISSDELLELKVVVPPEQASGLDIGDTVAVTSDLAPGRRFAGRISGVGGAAVFPPNDLPSDVEHLVRVVSATIEVRNDSGRLKAGTQADAHIKERTSP